MLNLLPKWLENRVEQKFITVANPGLGNNFSTIVPANKIWVVQAITFTFTAGPTVASRSIRTNFLVGGVPVAYSRAPVTITAGQSFTICGSIGNADIQASTAGISFSLPMLSLPANAIVASLIGSLQADDTIANVRLAVMEADVTQPT